MTSTLKRWLRDNCYAAAPNDLRREAGMTEERITNERTGGAKGKKPEQMSLLPMDVLLRDVAPIYTYGATKYDAHNWRKGYVWSLSYDALGRHLKAFWYGEDVDPESGCHHLSSVVFHALALLHFARTHPELDDRPPWPDIAPPTGDLSEGVEWKPPHPRKVRIVWPHSTLDHLVGTTTGRYRSDLRRVELRLEGPVPEKYRRFAESQGHPADVVWVPQAYLDYVEFDPTRRRIIDPEHCPTCGEPAAGGGLHQPALRPRTPRLPAP